MGQRASLAVLTERGTELYYTHWRANTLERDLFWGPAHATAFIRRQRSEADGAEILDDVWAEGGAVVDHTRQVLLWYGGEDTRWNVLLRRVHQALMSRLWPGWAIEWAPEGIADIADALGISRDAVLTRERNPAHDPQVGFESSGNPDWSRTVLSSLRNGELQLWTTCQDVDEVLSIGLPLLGSLAEVRGSATLDWTKISEDTPTGGLHVDWDRRELSFWHAADLAGIRPHVHAWFPGWRVVWWRDRFEAQTAAAQGRLVLPTPESEIDSLLASLREILLAEDRDYSGLIPSVLVKIGQPPQKINAFALRDDPLPLSPEERRRLLDEAMAGVRGQLGFGRQSG